MSSLEALIKQKKEIEEKIKALKDQQKDFGRARFSFERYPTQRPDDWYVAIKTKSGGFDGRYKKVIVHTDKEVVIKEMDALIADLSGLRIMIEE